MITDKDKTGRYMDRVESFIPKDILNAFADEVFDGTAFQPDEIKTCAEWIWSKAADQARKEAAERVACAWREHGADITLRTIRTAILGDSVVKENLITDHIPDTGKKLAIAVKALEYVASKSLPSSAFESHYSRLQDARAKASDALKEIQE